MARRSQRLAQLHSPQVEGDFSETLPPDLSHDSLRATPIPENPESAVEVHQIPNPQHSSPASALGCLGKLPLEIRREVYNYLLPGMPVISGRTCENEPGRGGSTTIMRTSEAIYREVWPMLYEERSYAVAIAHDWKLYISHKMVDSMSLNLQARLYKIDIREIEIYFIAHEKFSELEVKKMRALVHELVWVLKQAKSICTMMVEFLTVSGPPETGFAPDDTWITDQNIGVVLNTFLGACERLEKLHNVQEAVVKPLLTPQLLEKHPWVRQISKAVTRYLETQLTAPTDSVKEERKWSIRNLVQISPSGLRGSGDWFIKSGPEREIKELEGLDFIGPDAG